MRRIVWIPGLLVASFALVYFLDPLPVEANGFVPRNAPEEWLFTATALQSFILAIPLFVLLHGGCAIYFLSRIRGLLQELSDFPVLPFPAAAARIAAALGEAGILEEEAERLQTLARTPQTLPPSFQVFQAHSIARSLVAPEPLFLASLAAASAGLFAGCLAIIQTQGALFAPAMLFSSLGIAASLLTLLLALPQIGISRAMARRLTDLADILIPPAKQPDSHSMIESATTLEQAFRNISLRFESRLSDLPAHLGTALEKALAPQIAALHGAAEALSTDHARLARDIARAAAEGASGTIGAAVAADVRAVASSLETAIETAVHMAARMTGAAEALDKALAIQAKTLKTAMVGTVKSLKDTVQDGLYAQDEKMAAAVDSFSRTVVLMQTAAAQMEAAGQNLEAALLKTAEQTGAWHARGIPPANGVGLPENAPVSGPERLQRAIWALENAVAATDHQPSA